MATLTSMDLVKGLKMHILQGWKILKISTRPTSPYVGKFNNLHWKQSKFLLVLQHEALAMASGRVDFSSSDIIGQEQHYFWITTVYLN